MFKIKPNLLSDKIEPLDKQIERNSDDIALPKLSNNFMWIISASAGQGKTTLLMNLLKIKHSDGGLGKFYKKIYIFSPTHKLDKKRDDLIEELGDEQTYDDLNDSNVNDMVQKIKSEEDFKKDHYLVIMDDCLDALPKSVTKSPIHNLIISRRHLHCSIVVLTQSYVRVPNLWRRNSNLISFFGSNNKKEIESMVDDINYDHKTLEELIEFSTKEPHSFITIKLGQGKPLFYKKFSRIIL
jgi:hypothetical protein